MKKGPRVLHNPRGLIVCLIVMRHAGSQLVRNLFRLLLF